MALAFITHAISETGQLQSVSEICALARSLGVMTVVDIAQSLGVIPIDLGQWQADAVLVPALNGVALARGRPFYGSAIGWPRRWSLWIWDGSPMRRRLSSISMIFAMPREQKGFGGARLPYCLTCWRWRHCNSCALSAIVKFINTISAWGRGSWIVP